MSDSEKPQEHDEIEIQIPNGKVIEPESIKPESIKPESIKPESNVDSSNITTIEQLTSDILSKSEEDFIPWEEITLPSRGVYYNDKIPGGVVRVRAMGIYAEKIMATQRLAQTGQSIDYLFEHCVELPNGFNHIELLTGDRIFLLYYLRGITHGNLYEFMLKCPNCGSTSSHVYDLNELASTINGPKDELGDEPFRVDLPYFSQVYKKPFYAKVRLMRGKDISTIANRTRFNKRVKSSVPKQARQIEIDQSVTDNLSILITGFGMDGIKGDITGSAIKQTVDKMHARDTSTIREFLKNNSPGIDTTIEVQCPDCGHEFRTELPITESFFRPTSE